MPPTGFLEKPWPLTHRDCGQALKAKDPLTKLMVSLDGAAYAVPTLLAETVTREPESSYTDVRVSRVRGRRHASQCLDSRLVMHRPPSYACQPNKHLPAVDLRFCT